MKKLLTSLLVLLIGSVSLGADNLIGDGTSGSWQLIDNANVRWNAHLVYTTNGNSDVFTLGGLSASGDNIIGDDTSGNHQLIDNSGKRWGLDVVYTTDGAGNVIPITSGGGGGAAWGSITGTLSAQTDLQSALNAKQASLSFTAPLINTTNTISCRSASGSQSGCLSSSDWTTFNGKQAAGSYITALTGDVTAAGPGSSAATIASAAHDVWVNFDSAVGNDSTGTGTLWKPWHSLQHACSSISPSINFPIVIHLNGGNNDPDTGTITCPPNISIVSDYQIQISQALTISGGVANDGVTLKNVTVIGAFNWVRNDATIINLALIDTEFFSGPVYKQSGSGSASITCTNCVTVNADFQTGATGSFFNNPSFLGTTTFEDVNSSAYYQIQAGYVGGAMSISGAPFVYFSGVQFDVPFGASLTAVTTGNGSPTIQSDDASIPKVVAGTPDYVLQSHSNRTEYTPATSGNWLSSPGNVSDALDALSGGVPLGTYTSGSIPYFDGTKLTQDNAALFWDDSAKQLKLPASSIYVEKSATDAASVASEFHSSTHTTTDNSDNTYAAQMFASSVVDSGATNDKAAAGNVQTVTRGNGSDDGVQDLIAGTETVMFNNSGSGGITNKAIGYDLTVITQQGTITDLYDFKSERVPAGGTVTNHYGVYIASDPVTPVQNWLAGKTKIGGSSFSAPTADLTVEGDAYVSGIMQLTVQTLGNTPACASGADDGKVALTSTHILCVCNGSGWVKVADGSTACTF